MTPEEFYSKYGDLSAGKVTPEEFVKANPPVQRTAEVVKRTARPAAPKEPELRPEQKDLLKPIAPPSVAQGPEQPPTPAGQQASERMASLPHQDQGPEQPRKPLYDQVPGEGLAEKALNAAGQASSTTWGGVGDMADKMRGAQGAVLGYGATAPGMAGMKAGFAAGKPIGEELAFQAKPLFDEASVYRKKLMAALGVK